MALTAHLSAAPNKLRHPSWRVYKAIETINSDKERFPLDEDISPIDFGLKPDIDVYYPTEHNDEIVDELVDIIMRDDYKDTKQFYIQDCMSLFLNTKARQLIEGSLMEGKLAPDIATEMQLKIAMVEVYQTAFYDTSVWRTLADKLVYLSKGTVGDDAKIKNMVANKGMDFVKVNVFDMPAAVTMEKALSNIFGLAYAQIMNNIKDMDPESQKNAQIWTQRTLDIFKELKNAAKADGGIRELTIALETSKAPSKGLDDLT